MAEPTTGQLGNWDAGRIDPAPRELVVIKKDDGADVSAATAKLDALGIPYIVVPSGSQVDVWRLGV